MNTETLKKEHFNSLKEIADMSIKISEMREILTDLEKTEADFIKARENKANQQIDELLHKSKDLLEVIHNNNEEVHTLYTVISSYKDFLEEGHSTFRDLLADFNERSELWDKKVEKQYKEFGEIEKQAKKEQEDIKNRKEQLKKDEEQIRKDKIKIEDERQIIKRAIERLKEGRK